MNTNAMPHPVKGARRSGPRSRAARAALTLLLLVVVFVLAWLPEHLLLDPLLGSGPASDVIALVIPGLLTAAVAPMVSYRRRDAVAWVIPVLGLLLMARLAWRLASLPYRDWPPRTDEVGRCRQTPARTEDGSTWYVLVPEDI